MQRLEQILELDKQYVSEQMLSLLESEIKYAVKSYVVLSSNVKVRYKKEGKEIKFMVEFNAERVKNLGFIPQKNQ